MGYYISSIDDTYYESATKQNPDDEEVTQKPHEVCVWTGSSWRYDKEKTYQYIMQYNANKAEANIASLAAYYLDVNNASAFLLDLLSCYSYIDLLAHDNALTFETSFSDAYIAETGESEASMWAYFDVIKERRAAIGTVLGRFRSLENDISVAYSALGAEDDAIALLSYDYEEYIPTPS